MYAIQNTKTGKFVYSTDYRYFPFHQKTSENQMLTYEKLFVAKFDFIRRRCGKNYKIVELEPIRVKRIIPYDAEKGNDEDVD